MAASISARTPDPVGDFLLNPRALTRRAKLWPDQLQEVRTWVEEREWWASNGQSFGLGRAGDQPRRSS
ncbi:hypothetical protein VZT92_007773 [Zoarces viviparus]|uniref:Uncharacterized protein n=1 Tax=Zoarces viviparus TaxID=48416 RepID=A0AAW1FL18_ZOAVI